MDREVLLADLFERLGLSVPSEALPGMLRFMDELQRWNKRINLTAIIDPAQGLEKHLIDSLTVLPLLRGDERVLDLGSGAGFPGIPLKLARPDLCLVSVDSAGKKISFQRHIARQLGLREFTALPMRAEDIKARPEMAGGFEVIISRAFASLTEFTALAHPYLAPGGFLLAMKGAEGKRELAEASGKLGASGWKCSEVKYLRLPLSGSQRYLIILRRSV